MYFSSLKIQNWSDNPQGTIQKMTAWIAFSNSGDNYEYRTHQKSKVTINDDDHRIVIKILRRI